MNFGAAAAVGTAMPSGKKCPHVFLARRKERVLESVL
jgi:hypothetical protein